MEKKEIEENKSKNKNKALVLVASQASDDEPAQYFVASLANVMKRRLDSL